MATLALDYDELDQADDQSETERSAVLRRNKLQSRRELATSLAKNSGRGLELAGATSQISGKGMKLGAKAGSAVSTGLERAGTRMSASGAEMSATGYGAIVGVPLTVLGGITTAVGAGGQAASKFADQAGQAMDNEGRNLRQQGSRLVKKSKQAADLQGSGILDKADVLRQAKVSALRDRLNGSTITQAVGGEGSLFSNIFRLGTDALLRSSWQSLIPSWGLTLIWINIHIFLRFTLGDEYFNKLGHEWLSWGPAKSESGLASQAAGREAQELLKSAGDKFGFLEILAVLLLDILFIIVILLIISIIIFIVDLISQAVSLGQGSSSIST